MSENNDDRPDPDALLAQVQEQEYRATRGKLRIYFGASAGVGKTYAMLSAARRLRADGYDVIIGVVETHGRNETAALIEWLLVLPLKSIEYHSKTINEFDIDAALARRPALILIDELAHSNVPGSRHPKRWQDVDELLNSGIDVFTTVNVQHLESLNDVVGGITGIRVSETLPDTVFDEADEVVLVDIPADELLARLKVGKVYQAQQVEHASRNFFRKGNLIALRELALRRTAERIEDDVQAYRIEKSIDKIWKTDAALLACIGHRAGGEHVVRNAALLARQMNAEWHLIYIETPALQRLPSAHRERILQTLKLGETLGATTAILFGNDIAREIVSYARNHNFSKIILGRSHTTWTWRTPHLKRIAALASDIDLMELGRAATEPARAIDGSNLPNRSQSATVGLDESQPHRKQRRWHYVWAIAATLLTTLLATPLRVHFDLANIVMLFLLNVVLIAVRFGRGPAVVATGVGVIAFDFFFVPPRFSFAVSDWQYLLTFAVMLLVGLITAHLTSDLRHQARVASHRETRWRALYEFARELSAAVQTEQIVDMTRGFIALTFHARAMLMLPDDDGRLQQPIFVDGSSAMDKLDIGIAQWTFDRSTVAGIGTDTLPGSKFFYLPLVAPMRTRGVIAIQPESRHWILIPEQRQQLDTFAALAAIALERVHYIDVAQNALLHMESERLRNSLLAALSHDLRTPLTTIVELSESLTKTTLHASPKEKEFALALNEEAMRMDNLVTNLLDMARIQRGEVKLNLEWHQFEEVVKSALRASQLTLTRHKVAVQTRFASDLPIVRIDATLIERVLCNLFENVIKYTPIGSHMMITAEVSGRFLEVTVMDDGPGFPAGKEEALFEKFTRGARESDTPGIGLGLTICRAIIEAHGGVIYVRRTTGEAARGATLVFALPLVSTSVLPDQNESDGYNASSGLKKHEP